MSQHLLARTEENNEKPFWLKFWYYLANLRDSDGWIWCIGEMMSSARKPKCWSLETCLVATLSTTNTTWTAQCLKSGLYGEKLSWDLTVRVWTNGHAAVIEWLSPSWQPTTLQFLVRGRIRFQGSFLLHGPGYARLCMGRGQNFVTPILPKDALSPSSWVTAAMIVKT
jgi:hypothetical protein